jgi:U3 small nucleolar RNA-associated protein MPP10
MAASALPQDSYQSPTAQGILAVLSTSTHTFLRPTPSLHASSILIAKKYLDPLALSIGELQQIRQQENRKKRKRGVLEGPDFESTLQLRQVYVDGFTVDQVWEQAKRVLDATNDTVQRELVQYTERGHGDESNIVHDNSPSASTEEDLLEEDDGPMLAELEDGGDNSGLEFGDDASTDAEEVDVNGVADLNGVEEEQDDSEASDLPGRGFVQDPNGANDPFFDIDDFNRQTRFLENQDAKGDPDDGAASDEEEIDWSADHLAPKHPPPTSDSGVQDLFHSNVEDTEESEGEDGPTFGNAVSDEDGDEDDHAVEVEMDSTANTNDVQYADFFAPPPPKKSKSTRMRALPKTQPQDLKGQSFEEDTERAMADVRRDIFEDAMSHEDDSEDAEQGGQGNAPKPNLSTHERQKAKLADEIRQLEAANVAKREWALSGEARAVDRPMNSLIEEDFEFERTGKPVPVITNEVSEDIEELIKRRILAKEFDELIRRHPDSVKAAAQTRRGRVELDDTKAQQGLAELYEEDHLRATDPNFVDKRDDKLKREHDEISRLWQDISAKLDTLSNWHYKPKPQQASINVISDVPTISMEDARPSTGGAIGDNNMLAPQEMYAPGNDGKVQGEVLLKGGASMAKNEMTREEKLRRRRREKERAKKSGVQNKAGQSGKAAEKQEVLRDLKKGGVKVIGKKGDVKDVDGRKVSGRQTTKNGDVLKL